MKKNDTKRMTLVATARSKRKPGVLPGKRRAAIAEKKNALKPNAAKGRAVAVPRCHFDIEFSKTACTI